MTPDSCFSSGIYWGDGISCPFLIGLSIKKFALLQKFFDYFLPNLVSHSIIRTDGDIAQLGEHLLDVQRVAGSSPVVSSFLKPLKNQEKP